MFTLLSRYSISPAGGLSVCMFLADSKQRYWSADASKQVNWNGALAAYTRFPFHCGRRNRALRESGGGQHGQTPATLIVHCRWLACVVLVRQLVFCAPPLLPLPPSETTPSAHSLTSATVSPCTHSVCPHLRSTPAVRFARSHRHRERHAGTPLEARSGNIRLLF